MMDIKKKVLIVFILLVVLVVCFWLITRAITFYTGYSIKEIENIEEFTNCLAEKSELYIGAGCPYCKNQEEIFGDFPGNLKIIDCSLEPEICEEREITFVPTWIINGEKYVGEKNLKELAEITKCGV